MGAVGLPARTALLMAERNAWREVHELMHGGTRLKEAPEKVQNNSLFWMREVYERVISQQTKGKSKKGKDKKGSWGYPIRQPQWEKKGKGQGDKGGKGKGKTKSKPSDWPSNWAFKNPKIVPFCGDYFIKKSCQGQCGRSHNCPVVNSDGWVCNAGPKSISQKIALTRLARIGRLPVALWRILEAKRERTSLRGTVVQGHMLGPRLVVWIRQRLGVPRYPKDCGSRCSHLASGTAANGAVTPSKTGVH